MTVSSWGDVPPGVPMHHHCVVSIESSAEPRNWVDASTAEPALVAWQPGEVLQWVHDQLAEHVESSDDCYGRRGVIDDALCHLCADRRTARAHCRVDPGSVGVDGEHAADGRWTMTQYGLTMGRALTIQVLGYADADQRSGAGGRRYEVCRKHQRPADRPYLGLADSQREHVEQFARP
ncbi:hypothetical protein [Saccharopolyspora phatthalungensis]|uniref:Uncharacterized protein n=1 Tax=Saccharopolyspora phatthalungensis TaxID=664693 RepID=A0A840Q7R2_9PSEU|nr:hypothetical protein [Saccharopolyspora phatthalungensis]MBB5156744.1 hypothetical protein [Saccharopolyspora phatthalungensis]